MADPLNAVTAWLAEKNPGAGDVPPDTDLIENRLIDSLSFMEFIMLLESLAGRDIPVDSLEVDHFRTLEAIRRNFLDEDTPASAAAGKPTG